MKFNEKMLAKMRETTQMLVGNGPMAATVAIQEALQKGINPGHVASRQAWTTPQVRPMVDINAFPGKEAVDSATIADAGVGADFVPNLLAQLCILTGLDGGKLIQPELPSFGLLSPSHAPQTWLRHEADEVENDVGGVGRFIAGSYSNHAGSRTYKLYIPSGYRGQALPLTVMLHGCTQNPDDFALGTQMNAIAEEKQCFVVYPAQTQSANSSKCWNWFNALDQQRDQGEPSIIAGITRQIIDTHHIDADQVYVAGMSAGGAMAVIMGTLYPDLYTAVGVHSGLPYASAHDLPSALAAMKSGAGSKPARNGPAATDATARLGAIPIIVFHGDRDTTVHPRNGEKIMTQNAGPASAASPGASEPKVQRGQIPNGHAYTQTSHHNAGGQVVAEHWVIHGAAHAWSGGSMRGSYTDSKGPDAAQEMMRFFSTQAKT